MATVVLMPCLQSKEPHRERIRFVLNTLFSLINISRFFAYTVFTIKSYRLYCLYIQYLEMEGSRTMDYSQLKQDAANAQYKLACVQFIAEVSLITNCKPAELQMALSIITDVVSRDESPQRDDDLLFYPADENG